MNKNHDKLGRFATGHGLAAGISHTMGAVHSAGHTPKPALAEEHWRPENIGSRLTGKQKKEIDGKRNPKLSRDKQEAALAVTMSLYKRATDVSEPLTDEILSVVGRSGGEMSQLNQRVKFPPSLFRKVQAEMVEKGIDAETAGKSMRDTVRFTAVYPAGGSWEAGNTLRDRVIASGATPVKNPPGIQFGGGYRGRNMTFVKDGVEFELQTQTPESMEVKGINHKMLEVADRDYKYDDSPRGKAVKEKLNRTMQENVDRNIVIEAGTPVQIFDNKSSVWYTADRTGLAGPTLPAGHTGSWNEADGPRLKTLEQAMAELDAEGK